MNSSWLDRAIDADTDHVLGPFGAEIMLVEYGSYACPHCRAANERIAQVRGELGERVQYVFRHLPLSNNDMAFRAAELAELASTPNEFWDAHIKLMTRSSQLTEDDLAAVALDRWLYVGLRSIGSGVLCGKRGNASSTIFRARVLAA